MPKSRDDLVQILFDRQDDMAKWSPTVYDCRVSKKTIEKENFNVFCFRLDFGIYQCGFVRQVNELIQRSIRFV